MRFRSLFLTVCLYAALVRPEFAQQQKVTISDYVLITTRAGDFASAESALKQYRAALGVTPEYLVALSSLGRAQLGRSNYDAAEKNATEVRSLCTAELAHRAVDSEPGLPLALGASIEVHAQALAEQHRRDEAVLFLNDELKKWQKTSMRERIQKNINLLTLEGKPVPVLDVSAGIGSRSRCPCRRTAAIRCCCFFGRTGVRIVKTKLQSCTS